MAEKFETKRLILREITESDTNEIVRWRSDPGVYCYFYRPHRITTEEHLNWYRNVYVLNANRIDFIAIEKMSNKRIGLFGIVRDKNNAEVSYLLDHRYQGKGYASEAVSGLIVFACKIWKIKSVSAGIHKDNTASIRLIKNLGFQQTKQEGDFLFYQKDLNMKNLYIRADGNSEIGTGHIMRCISIAEEYQRCGGRTVFIVADERSESLLKGRNFQVIKLNSVWNDLDQETDQMIQLIKEYQISLLLIDSYFVTQRYLETLHQYTRLYYIDDLEKFPYSVDFLIDYNIYANLDDYEKLYNQSKKKPSFLIGTKYAPLRQEFSRCSEKKVNRIKNVLVSTGGTDSYHVALNLVKYLKGNNLFKNIIFHVVVGFMNRDYEEIKNISSGMNNVVLYHPAKDMFGLMNLCDVAISAAGTTLYELCAVGVPVITYVLADNQIRASKSFVKKGVMLYGKDIRDEKDYPVEMFHCLHVLEQNPAEVKYISHTCQSMVDGKGSNRIVDELIRSMLR